MLLFGDTPNEGELCMLWPPDVPFEAFLRRATEEGSEWWSEIYWSATVNQTLCLKRGDIWSTAQNKIYKRISGSYAVVKDWSSGTKKMLHGSGCDDQMWQGEAGLIVWSPPAPLESWQTKAWLGGNGWNGSQMCDKKKATRQAIKEIWTGKHLTRFTCEPARWISKESYGYSEWK